MPEFQLDTSGFIDFGERNWQANPRGVFCKRTTMDWDALTPFMQGYVTALFFTEEEELNRQLVEDYGCTEGDPLGFSDLAPEALAQIIEDCARFGAHLDQSTAEALDARETEAGHDFWLTRNGHGAGFWDGDYKEPYATELTEACKAFGECSVYLGDDGKVYLS